MAGEPRRNIFEGVVDNLRSLFKLRALKTSGKDSVLVPKKIYDKLLKKVTGGEGKYYDALGKLTQWYFDDVLEKVKVGAPSRTERYKEYCLSGDTKIKLASGKDVTIRDLVGIPEFFVFSFDISAKKIVVGRGHSCHQTGKKSKIISVELDNGQKIKCTPDHLFLVRTGEYVKAKDLKIGVSVMSCKILRNKSGYLQVYQPFNKLPVTCHALADEYNLLTRVYEKSYGSVRHHIDFNRDNNDPSNIVRMGWQSHQKLHKENSVKNINKLWANPDFVRKMSEKRIQMNNEMWKNSEFIQKVSDYWNSGGREKQRKILSNLKQNVEFVKKTKDASRINLVSLWMNKVFRVKNSKRISDRLRLKWKNLEYRKCMCVEAERGKIKSIARKIIENGLSLKEWDNSVNKLSLNLKRSLKSVNKYFGSLEGLEQCLGLYNCKVKSTSSSVDYEDVYDFTVDNYHNFALTSGVFVHNSFMDGNSVEAGLALDTYADETVQLGRTDEIITVHTNDKAQKLYLESKIKDLRFSKRIRDIARNLAKFGDYPLALEVEDGEGVTDVEPVPVMKFSRIDKRWDEMEQQLGMKRYGTDKTEEDDSEKFSIDKIRKVCIGYKVFDYQLEPWQLSHFKIYTSDSDFHPYGRGLLESSRTIFRQLISSEILMALSRAHRFDRYNYEVDAGNHDDPTKSWAIMEKVRQLHDENVMHQQAYAYKNPIGLLENIWSVKDVLNVKRLGISPNLGDISDVSYLYEKYLTGLRLPKAYLLADQSSGYREGSLVRQDIKFGRLIYTLQSAILEGLILTLKIDQIAARKDDKFNINGFALSMPFPAPRLNLEEAAVKKEQYTNAIEILKSIKELLGAEKFTPDLLKAILVRFSKIDEDEADFLITHIKKVEIDLSKTIDKKTEESLVKSLTEEMERNNTKHDIFNGPSKFPLIEVIKDDRHIVKDIYFDNFPMLERAKIKLCEGRRKRE